MEKGDIFYETKRTKYHYIGEIIDDGKSKNDHRTLVVFKKWNKLSWSWDYKCETLEHFNLFFKLGFYTLKK